MSLVAAANSDAPEQRSVKPVRNATSREFQDNKSQPQAINSNLQFSGRLDITVPRGASQFVHPGQRRRQFDIAMAIGALLVHPTNSFVPQHRQSGTADDRLTQFVLHFRHQWST